MSKWIKEWFAKRKERRELIERRSSLLVEARLLEPSIDHYQYMVGMFISCGSLAPESMMESYAARVIRYAEIARELESIGEVLQPSTFDQFSSLNRP